MLSISFLFMSLAGAEIGGSIRDPDTRYRQVDFSTQLSVRSGFTAARCRGIADVSSKVRPLFQVKENGEWECTYLLEYPETSHSPSLFIQVRGVHPEQWSSFRLKLNFGSLLSRQVLGGRAAAIVYTLIGDQSPLRELDVTLALGREFDLSFSGITLRYKQEAFDASRYNLYGGNALEAAKPHQ